MTREKINDANDDDINTMRLLFNAVIGDLCNQCRHNDAEEMEGIRGRLIKRLLEKNKVYEWIPVESALPEVVFGELDIRCSEDVLVYDGADLRVGYFVRIEKFDRGYWNIYGDDCFEPIAWMPLPEPYKAESEVQE